MLDYRMMTFVTLCETMNYRKAAEVLNITQPGVTQHIHYLEDAYGCKLFDYHNRVLKQTEAGLLLEQYARGAMYNEKKLKDALGQPQPKILRIGATKTIGNYTMGHQIESLGGDPNLHTTVYIDNTENLLRMLDRNEIDFAAVEGFFDKSHYAYQLIKMEPFLGVCSKTHPFANRQIELEEIFDQMLIVREVGSGTRAIFERLIGSRSYSVERFKHVVCLSSFELIKTSLLVHGGITFAYKAFADYYDELATFQIQDGYVEREFNYVYLKHSSAVEMIERYMKGK